MAKKKNSNISREAKDQLNVFNELEQAEYPSKEEIENLKTGNVYNEVASSGSDFVSLNDYNEDVVNDVHKQMPVKVLEKLRRTPTMNNNILIQVRHKSASLPNSISMVDLCYYDKKESKLINKEIIPLFYREHYKGMYGRDDLIFYCRRRDLKDIEKMLNADKEKVTKVDDEFNDFLSRVSGDAKEHNSSKLKKGEKLSDLDEEILDKLDK